jgi:3-oxoacyl-[acyl-carrier protein] reductase
LNQVAIVTGGANGIGRAVAHRMASAGIFVVVADQDGPAAENVRAEIAGKIGEAEAVQVDVTQAAEVKAVAEAMERRHGRIDILANIAGGSFYTKRMEDLSWPEWKEVIDVNLKGTFLFCREVGRIMRRQKSGRMINTSSNYGFTGSAMRTPYAAAKAGILGFTKSLAQELAPDGILVNAVAPGPTDTPRVIAKESTEARRQRWATIPLGRTARPEEVAEMFYYLVTPESAWITGQTFHVNGGLVMP